MASHAYTPPEEETDDMAKDLTTTPAQDPQSETSAMLTIIERAALNPDVDVEKMKQLLDMQERVFDKNAEIAFNKAMVRAQKRMRPIVRDAENQQTHSKYARLETIDRQIRPIYTEEGFSLSFGTDESRVEKYIGIICDVMHEEGHVKRYRADIPIDLHGMKGTPNKTGTHAFGSTISYGQRYITKLIFNIALANEDDDGNAAGGAKTVTLFQVGILTQTLSQTSQDVQDWFYQTYGDPVNVPKAQFDGLLATLRKRSLAAKEGSENVSRETSEGEE